MNGIDNENNCGRSDIPRERVGRVLLPLLIWLAIGLISLSHGYGQTGGAVKVAQKIFLGKAVLQVERLSVRSAQAFAKIGATRSLAMNGAGGMAFIGLEDDVVKCIVKAADNSIIEIDDLARANLAAHDIYIEAEVYTSSKFKELKDQLDFVHVYHDDFIYHVSTKDDIIQLSPNLLYRISDGHELSNLLRFKTWVVDKEEMAIAGVFSPTYEMSIYKGLEAVAKKNQISFDVLSRENLASVFRKNKKKTVFLTGHFENQQFYARDIKLNKIADQTFSMEEIENLARENEIYTIYLGCHTSSSAPTAGLLNSIYDDEVIARLTNAFDQEHFVDFFASLGSADCPLLVKGMTVREGQIAIEFEFAPTTIRAVLQPMSKSFIRMTGVNAVPTELPRGFQAFLLGTVNFWYALGIAVTGFLGLCFLPEAKNGKEFTFAQGISCFLCILPLPLWLLGKIILFLFY